MIDPKDIRLAFTIIFSLLQRGKVLEKYAFLDNKYLLLSDGTGYFSSSKIHCENCCERHHKNECDLLSSIARSGTSRSQGSHPYLPGTDNKKGWGN